MVWVGNSEQERIQKSAQLQPESRARRWSRFWWQCRGKYKAHPLRIGRITTPKWYHIIVHARSGLQQITSITIDLHRQKGVVARIPKYYPPLSLIIIIINTTYHSMRYIHASRWNRRRASGVFAFRITFYSCRFWRRTSMLPIFYACSIQSAFNSPNKFKVNFIYRDGDIPTLSISLSVPYGFASKNDFLLL